MGKLAEAYVEIRAEDSKLNNDLNAAQGKLSVWSRSMGGSLSSLSATASDLAAPIGLATAAAVAFAAAAAKGAEFLVQCGNKAADLAEAVNKVEVAFGPSAAIVKAFANDAATAFGLVKKDVLDASAGIGLMVQGMGLGQEESARLANRLSMLAADAMSLHNISLNDVLGKIRSGLSGESEPLRVLGVNLLETTVQAHAVEMGLARAGEEVSDYAKVTSRADLIIRGLSSANDDLANTSDSLSNKQRALAGDWENLQAEIGEAFAEPMADAISLLYEAGDAISDLTGGASAFQVLADAIQGVVDQLRLFVSEGDAASGVLLGFLAYVQKLTGDKFVSQDFLDTFVEDRENKLDAIEEERKKRRQKRKPQADWEPGTNDPNAEANTSKEIAKEAEKTRKHVESLRDKYATSTEKYEKTRDEANSLFAWGDIDGDLRNRMVAQDADQAIEKARDRVFDLENSTKSQSGQVLGDLFGSHNTLQNQALQADTQREQLETAKKQLEKLEAIREAMLENKPGAYDQLQAVVKGRE